eukprot:2516765-Rhodomonas_salina.1
MCYALPGTEAQASNLCWYGAKSICIPHPSQTILKRRSGFQVLSLYVGPVSLAGVLDGAGTRAAREGGSARREDHVRDSDTHEAVSWSA